MKKMLPVQELARDNRFWRSRFEDNFSDPRIGAARVRGSFQRAERMAPQERNAPEGARSLMHGIFMGEIQALEGAGRTCFDFDTGPGEDEAPFALKLDMARQCWDESRHVEISIKLNQWMGSEIGEFSENTFLYEAACNPDPVMRLTGVNRALEGLAIDVFNTMKAFGEACGDPVMTFCEDWMLADEVTHVKMGSDWLRRLTENNPERRAAPSSSSASSTSCSASAAFARTRTRAPSSWPASSASSPASRRKRSTRSPMSLLRPRTRRCSGSAAEPRVATVKVTPQTFEFVSFDAAEIEKIASELADAIGLDDDVVVEVNIDEAIMQGQSNSRIEGRTIIVDATGGAYESLRKAREFSAERCRASLGQSMMRARDRLDPAFGAAPADDELDVNLESAWASSIEGRLTRIGVPGRPQRRLYHFRVRHGFDDRADTAFHKLYDSDTLTWSDIAGISAGAQGAETPASA